MRKTTAQFLSGLALLILGVWLCAFDAAFAQVGGLSFPGPGGPRAASGGGCTQASTWLSGKTTTWTTAYTTMICGLNTDGTLSLFDRLYVLATDSSTNALTDIITNTAAAITGTAAFTANSGYVSASGTLNTGLNYSTATNYKQNSALLMAWTTGLVNDNNCPIGEASGAFDIFMSPYTSGNVVNGISNGGSFSVANPSAAGLCWSRSERTRAHYCL